MTLSAAEHEWVAEQLEKAPPMSEETKARLSVIFWGSAAVTAPLPTEKAA